MAALWWLAACALSACGAARGFHAAWPGCSAAPTRWFPVRLVDPGHRNGNVTGIRLVNCSFTPVNLDSLKSYPYVRYIHLENIKATNGLDMLTNLEEFTMKNTSILGENLPSNFFRNCRSLNHISIIDSDMSHAPPELLQGVGLLKTLNLNNCALRSVPLFFTSQVFPNMDYFQAIHSEIKLNGPDTFANAINLKKMILTNNSIDNIHVDTLKPLTKIQMIWLDYNRLRGIPETLFQNLTSLILLDLSHNLIENIPLNAFVGTDLITLHLNDNRLTHLPANFFSNLQTNGVHIKLFNFSGNPWECGCLNQLLDNLKKLNIDNDGSQYDGRHQVCQYYDSTLLVPMPTITVVRYNCA